ncbi:hypothetical protein AB835_07085 [Candidatus Endobugula sertula]|uniref:Uncharacterized protein n=1 Tax=Candidatus Endobugula sertula TaxID=62101 RepID=A0A1D2QQ87_9GAMM|nr:hypothetical protein AB835_07085 [Candidatus Endobugula sertula]
MAKDIAANLQKAQEQQNTVIHDRQNQLNAKLEIMTSQHKHQREELETTQETQGNQSPSSAIQQRLTRPMATPQWATWQDQTPE